MKLCSWGTSKSPSICLSNNQLHFLLKRVSAQVILVISNVCPPCSTKSPWQIRLCNNCSQCMNACLWFGVGDIYGMIITCSFVQLNAYLSFGCVYVPMKIIISVHGKSNHLESSQRSIMSTNGVAIKSRTLKDKQTRAHTQDATVHIQ